MNNDSHNVKENIMIVDDVPANLRLLSSFLTREGYEVRPVSDGRLALSGAQAMPPDLILLDIKMPEMNGYEVCEQLKGNEKTREIPVIFLSALDAVEDKIKAFSHGGVDYITKPFQSQEVIARVRTHLALQTSYKLIKAQQEQIQKELEQARKTQLAILPQSLPQIPNVEIITKFVPTDQIGGDIYYIFELSQGKYGIMMADLTGHGISAALLSFMVSGIFKDLPKTEKSTAATIKLLNQALLPQMPDGKFATLFYGIYDAVKQTLLYTNAGHPIGQVIRNHSNEFFELDTEGGVVGILSNAENNFKEKEFQLQPGDKLLLYTDALVDVFFKKSQNLGISRTEILFDYVKTQSHLPIAELLEQVFQYGLSHTEDNHFDDDCTMIGLEVTA